MALSAKVRNGWLEVSCDAHDRAQVYVAVTPTAATEPIQAEWRPGFRDWDDQGNRVAKIRPPMRGTCVVWLDVDGNKIRLSKPVVL